MADITSKEVQQRVHELKTWPPYFQDVLDGKKPFELRKNDRDYNVGDILHLMEWVPDNGYTGRTTDRIVTYVLRGPGFGLAEGYAVLGMALLSPPTSSSVEMVAIPRWMAHEVLYAVTEQKDRVQALADIDPTDREENQKRADRLSEVKRYLSTALKGQGGTTKADARTIARRIIDRAGALSQKRSDENHAGEWYIVDRNDLWDAIEQELGGTNQ